MNLGWCDPKSELTFKFLSQYSTGLISVAVHHCEDFLLQVEVCFKDNLFFFFGKFNITNVYFSKQVNTLIIS